MEAQVEVAERSRTRSKNSVGNFRSIYQLIFSMSFVSHANHFLAGSSNHRSALVKSLSRLGIAVLRPRIDVGYLHSLRGIYVSMLNSLIFIVLDAVSVPVARRCSEG